MARRPAAARRARRRRVCRILPGGPRERRTPDQARFRAIITAYKASDDYKKLADTTKRNWSRWLDRIGEYFGDLRIAQFDRPEKIRPIIRRWRGQWADKPRNADYGMQVLSRVLSYAVDPFGKIAGNPCEGIKQLYSSDRSEIIWTDSDIAEIKRTCASEIAHAVDLAAATGLRLGDLLRLSWSHIGDDAIVLTTGKSKHRREALIPLYGELQARSRRDPSAIYRHPHKQPRAALDRQRLRHRVQPGQDRRRHGRPRSAFSRPPRDRGDEVLHRRTVRARDRRNHGLGGGATSPRSFAAMSVGRPQPRRRSPNLTGRNGEHNLQNRLQNRQPNFS